MLAPISILLGTMWLLDKHNERLASAKESKPEPTMKPQPKFTSSAIDLVVSKAPEGHRVFRPNAMGDAVKALESSSLELVQFDKGPSDILIYRLVPLAWGAETAANALAKARNKGVYVLASLSLALSDPRETELLILFGGKSATQYANERGVFAVLAVPNPPVEPKAEVEEEVKAEPTQVASPKKRNGKAEKPAPFPDTTPEETPEAEA